MKKKLEAELISIAHRILKLKNKSDVVQLHQETQKLYEKLSVLRFVEEHLTDLKPTIGLSEMEEKIESAFESEAPAATESEWNSNENADELAEAAVIDSNESEEEISEVAFSAEEQALQDAGDADESVSTFEEEAQEGSGEEEVSFKPAFELSFDAQEEEEEKKETAKPASTQITFDDLLGPDYVDPVFVKPEELVQNKETHDPSTVIPIGRSYNDAAPVIPMNKDLGSNTISLNDRMAKGIIIGLNDRIAFMNHLFANSSEDYNRVLSQLMTFDSFQEARDFIDNIVKPDYDNWEGKEEYAERFMQIVEKRFS